MGSIFKPKAPKIEPPAPPVEQVTPEPVEPEMGVQVTPEQKKRKGKKGLKIDMTSPKSGSGLNIS